MSYTNNAYGTLLGSIGTDTTTITIKDSKGSLFPDTYPFYLTLEQIDNGIVSKREIVECTNKSGDTFTIIRSAGYCPANDNATTQTNTAFAFEDGTLVQLRLLSEDVNKINSDISNKLNKDGELRTGLGANKIIYTDGSGNETELPLGNASQVLTSNGTDQTPSFTSPSVDIDGQAEKTSLNTSDEFIIYDSVGGNNKKIKLTQLTKMPNTGYYIAGEDITSNTVALHSDGKVYNYASDTDMYIGTADTTYTSGDTVSVYQIGTVSISGFNFNDDLYVGFRQGNSWTTKVDMTTARDSLTSGVVDNKIYCIGGNYGNNELSTNEEYDVINNSWTSKADMTTARYLLTSSVVDGKIYCIGGNDGSNTLATNEEYDPSTDTWNSKANITTARHSLTSGVVDGKIYVIGGKNGSNILATNEEYDPVNDTWNSKADITTARYSLTSGVVDGKIYCIGGYDGNTLATNEEYDPVNDSWTTKADMINDRYILTSGVVDGKIYCIGGYDGNNELATNEEYDPSTDTWNSKADMTTARYLLTSSVVDGKIYCIGGKNGNTLATNEEYIATSIYGINNKQLGYKIGKGIDDSNIFLNNI